MGITRRRGQVCLLLVFALSTCSPDRSGAPPPLTVRAPEDEVQVDVGTYCAGEACADAVVEDGPLLRVEQGGSLTFDWAWAPADMEVTLCRGFNFLARCQRAQSEEIGVGDDWELRAPPGNYRASAFITFPEGDASYKWKVVIAP